MKLMLTTYIVGFTIGAALHGQWGYPGGYRHCHTRCYSISTVSSGPVDHPVTTPTATGSPPNVFLISAKPDVPANSTVERASLASEAGSALLDNQPARPDAIPPPAWADQPSVYYARNLVYMRAHNSKKFSDEYLMARLDDFYNAVDGYPELPRERTVAMFVRLARYESRFEKDDVNRSSGATGTLQLLGHRRSMKKLGLDFDVDFDRCRYACVLVKGKQAKGRSFKRWFSDWAPTLSRAWRDMPEEMK